jgi:hypothetical protein
MLTKISVSPIGHFKESVFTRRIGKLIITDEWPPMLIQIGRFIDNIVALRSGKIVDHGVTSTGRFTESMVDIGTMLKIAIVIGNARHY